jgi:hypothetical protein
VERHVSGKIDLDGREIYREPEKRYKTIVGRRNQKRDVDSV